MDYISAMSRDNLYRATCPRVSDTVFLRLLSMIRPERVRVQWQCCDICNYVYRVCQCHDSRQSGRIAPAAVTMSDLLTRKRMFTLNHTHHPLQRLVWCSSWIAPQVRLNSLLAVYSNICATYVYIQCCWYKLYHVKRSVQTIQLCSLRQGTMSPWSMFHAVPGCCKCFQQCRIAPKSQLSQS